MRNLLLVTLLLTVSTNLLFAQAETVEYSAPFDEPENGYRKVLQLSNGNTIFLHYEGKEGLNVTVYNPERKVISKRTITGRQWEPKETRTSKVAGLYEIDGAPVIFIQQLLKRVPTLFRLILDPATGAMKEEKKLGELEKLPGGMGYAMVFGGVQEPMYHVEKCPDGNNYAVIDYNSIAKESDERIKVRYFTVENGQHTATGESFYEAQGFKYINYVSSYVRDDAFFICTYGYNTQKSGGKDSRVIISRLDNNGTAFTHKKIEFTEDFADTRGVMTYNPASGMIQMLTLTFLESKKGTKTYMALMSYIDPASLQVVKSAPLPFEYAAMRVKEDFKEDRFTAMPQYVVVNKDNSTSVIMEEMTKAMTSSYGIKATERAVATHLGNIGISELDMNGKEVTGYAAKKQQRASADMPVFGLSDRAKGRWTYVPPGSILTGNNSAFYSFNYVNTENGKYLIFNDFPENFDKDGAKKINEVDAASNMHTVYYELENGFFKKHYLYGTPGKDQLKFTNIESADVKEDSYASLMVERDGRRKKAKIVWVKFK